MQISTWRPRGNPQMVGDCPIGADADPVGVLSEKHDIGASTLQGAKKAINEGWTREVMDGRRSVFEQQQKTEAELPKNPKARLIELLVHLQL